MNLTTCSVAGEYDRVRSCDDLPLGPPEARVGILNLTDLEP